MSRREKPGGLGTAGCLAIHLVLVAAAVAWGAHRARELASEREPPPLRREPLTISPLYDDAGVVSDEQLRRVLSRLGLRLRGRETSIGHVDHGLRLWGASAEFGDTELLSGAELRRLLTDHRRFAEVYGADQAPLLIDDGQGIRVRFLEGLASSSHRDHTLGSLAEVGTPVDFPIVTARRQTTLRAVLEKSLRDFSLNQPEYEWSALAFALYLPPRSRWITSEGQEVTFDRLAARIMREELPSGVCSANHRLHTLVVFLRVDDLMRAAGEPQILAPETREWIVAFLQEVTASFVSHQHPDGFWNRDWPTAVPAGSEPSDREGDRLSNRLISTGHVLEWWALAPGEIQPPRPVVTAAAQWLVRRVDRLAPEEIVHNYTYVSHAGRALALWRGRLPAEVKLEPPAGRQRPPSIPPAPPAGIP